MNREDVLRQAQQVYPSVMSFDRLNNSTRFTALVVDNLVRDGALVYVDDSKLRFLAPLVATPLVSADFAALVTNAVVCEQSQSDRVPS